MSKMQQIYSKYIAEMIEEVLKDHIIAKARHIERASDQCMQSC